MKRLYILRHGKSSWSQPGQGDIDRPLNARGLEQMLLLSRWWRQEGVRPDAVICSPAARTRETLSQLREGLADDPLELDVTYEQALYMGSCDDYLQILWGQAAQTVLVVGHNPTCDELSRWLAAPSSPAAHKLMASHFGTGSLAVFDLDLADWTAIGRGSGQLVEFLRPKDIEPSRSSRA